MVTGENIKFWGVKVLELFRPQECEDGGASRDFWQQLRLFYDELREKSQP